VNFSLPSGRLIRVASLCLVLAIALGGCSGSKSKSPDGEEPASPVPVSKGRALPAGDDPLIFAEGPYLSRIDASGQSEILHLDGGAYILDPSIAAGQLAFVIQPPATTGANGTPDFGSDLYAAPRSGGQLKLLVKHSAPGEFVRSPAWLPDGRQLFFDVRGVDSSGQPDLRIERLDLSTGARQRYLEGAIFPVISPDGRSLAFVRVDAATSHEDIQVIDLETQATTSLLGPQSSKLMISSLAWSPDGSRLIFAAADPLVLAAPSAGTGQGSTAHPTLQDLWLINRDASGLRRLIDFGESQPSAVWSARGNVIYAMASQGFLVIDVESGKMQRLGQGSQGGQITLLGAH
jgi:Tol biopolymer transport system component